MPRGGRRPGAGRPRKSLADKQLEGSRKDRLTVLSFPGVQPGGPLPTPSERLPAFAQPLFTQTAAWLQSVGCLHLIPPLQLEQYAFWLGHALECRRLTPSSYLVTDRKTGQEVPSPYVKLATTFAQLADRVWEASIWPIVKAAGTAPAKLAPPGDSMGRLLDLRPTGAPATPTEEPPSPP